MTEDLHMKVKEKKTEKNEQSLGSRVQSALTGASSLSELLDVINASFS